MLEKRRFYLDSNSGACLSPSVLAWLKEWLGSSRPSLFNPSSIHSHGREVRKQLSEAKESVARSLGGVSPDQLIFCSSGTEANQLAVRSALENTTSASFPLHWITSAVEHDSLRQLVRWARERGVRVTEVPVNSQGLFQIDFLEQTLKEAASEKKGSLQRGGVVSPPAVLMSFVWVNNETGVINPVEPLVELSQRFGVPLHLDAAQAWGKLPCSLKTLGAQWVSFSAHKIGALAGMGLLWMAPQQKLHPLLLGKQEIGRRGGTENVIGILAAGKAAADLSTFRSPQAWIARVQPWRDALQEEIQAVLSGVKVHGEGAPRVANTLNVSFEGLRGEGLVMALDLAGYSVSAGSACSSGVLEPSHVLQAMGCHPQEAMSAIRISLQGSEWFEGDGVVDSESSIRAERPWGPFVKEFVQVLATIVQRIRAKERSSF